MLPVGQSVFWRHCTHCRAEVRHFGVGAEQLLLDVQVVGAGWQAFATQRSPFVQSLLERHFTHAPEPALQREPLGLPMQSPSCLQPCGMLWQRASAPHVLLGGEQSAAEAHSTQTCFCASQAGRPGCPAQSSDATQCPGFTTHDRLSCEHSCQSSGQSGFDRHPTHSPVSVAQNFAEPVQSPFEWQPPLVGFAQNPLVQIRPVPQSVESRHAWAVPQHPARQDPDPHSEFAVQLCAAPQPLSVAPAGAAHFEAMHVWPAPQSPLNLHVFTPPPHPARAAVATATRAAFEARRAPSELLNGRPAGNLVFT